MNAKLLEHGLGAISALALVVAGVFASAAGTASAATSAYGPAGSRFNASSACLETLRQDLQTVLPKGLSDAEACSALQTVTPAQQAGIIPVTGDSATASDTLACWHDAGAGTCP